MVVLGHRNNLWFAIKNSRNYKEGIGRNHWTNRWCGQGHCLSGPAHLPSLLSPCSPPPSDTWVLPVCWVSDHWTPCTVPSDWTAWPQFLGLLSPPWGLRSGVMSSPCPALLLCTHHVFLSLHWSSCVDIAQMSICLSHWTGDHPLDPWAQIWPSDRIMLYLACSTWAHMVFLKIFLHSLPKIKNQEISHKTPDFWLPWTNWKSSTMNALLQPHGRAEPGILHFSTVPTTSHCLCKKTSYQSHLS